jgi:uncharacterized membrane protein YjjP (DUF1212 family)
MTIASVLAGIVSYILTKLLPLRATDNSFFSTFPKFCIISIVSLAFYLAVCVAFRIKEVRPIIDRLVKIFFKNAKVEPKK